MREHDPSGLLGGYSQAFDLISSEYGWNDEEIYNLTLRRFRQITAAINRRRYFEDRRERTLVSWQTRTIAMFVAGGYMTDGKHENTAVKAAADIAIDDIEKAQLEEAENQPKSYEELVKPGSFERFMGSMGDTTKWK